MFRYSLSGFSGRMHIRIVKERRRFVAIRSFWTLLATAVSLDAGCLLESEISRKCNSVGMGMNVYMSIYICMYRYMYV